MRVFFCMENIEDRTITPEGPSRVSLKSRKIAPQPIYKVENKEVSSNIQRFDKRARINPFAFNSVSLKKQDKEIKLTQSASDLITIPEYSNAGRILGIDMARDWNEYYDKIFKIVEHAKRKTGLTGQKLTSWIYAQANKAPSMSNKKIEDLYIYLHI